MPRRYVTQQRPISGAAERSDHVWAGCRLYHREKVSTHAVPVMAVPVMAVPVIAIGRGKCV